MRPNITEDVVVEDVDGPRGTYTGIRLVIPVEKIVETLTRPPRIISKRRAAANEVSPQRRKARVARCNRNGGVRGNGSDRQRRVDLSLRPTSSRGAAGL